MQGFAIFRNHVRGEQVDLVDRVVTLFPVVRFELAEISGAGPHGGGLHLHAKEVLTVFNPNVIWEGASTRPADGELMQRGLCHELQLRPLAPLLKGLELFPTFHLWPKPFCLRSFPPQDRAPHRPERGRYPERCIRAWF
jgi:hypothetical protein